MEINCDQSLEFTAISVFMILVCLGRLSYSTDFNSFPNYGKTLDWIKKKKKLKEFSDYKIY